MRTFTAAAMAGIMMLAGAQQAFAFGEDTEARKAIYELQDRMAQAQNALVMLNSEITKLRNELRTTIGANEQLSRDMARVLTQQVQMNERLKALEPVSVTVNGKEVSVDKDLMAAFDSAKQAFNRKEFRQAEKEFRAIQKRWPNSPMTDQVLYWQGSSSFSAQNFDGAIASLGQFTSRFPKAPQAPDAMLMRAMSMDAIGRRADALSVLDQVIGRYPGTDAAANARQLRSSLAPRGAAPKTAAPAAKAQKATKPASKASASKGSARPAIRPPSGR